MKTKRIGLHKIALAALFTVGSVLIGFPWRESEGQLPWVAAISLIGGLLTVLLLYPVARRIWRSPMGSRRGRILWVGALSLLLGGCAFWSAWTGCRDYVAFSQRLILPEGSRFLQAFLFLSCAVAVARLTDRGMDAFALTVFGVAVISVTVLFLAGMPEFQWELFPKELPEFSPSARVCAVTLGRELLLPLAVLTVYFALTSPRGGSVAIAVGTGVGCLLLFVCVTQAILTFGASYAGKLPYPYAYSTRIPSVGRYFFRLEGFSYLVNYAACLIRCGVSLAVIRQLFARFFPRRGRYVPWVTGAALLIFL